MSAVLVTAEVLARELQVSPPAVAQAKKSGRLSVIPTPDGDRFDLAVAKIQWEAKTRREAAEASIAELKEAELRGELVRKVEVERAIASRLVALRESLEVLADRLSALVAAESDAQACRRMLRDEHRKALATFTEQMLVADGAGDGRT